MNVDGYVSSGGLGGPAILPLSLAKMAQMTRAFPDAVVLRHRRHLRLRATRSTTSCSAAARCRCAPPRCSTTPSVRTSSRDLAGRPVASSSRRHAERGWTTLEDFRGLLRDRVVAQSQDPPAGARRLPGRLRAPGGIRGAGAVGQPPEVSVMATTLIKNGTIVTASDRYEADVYIDKGVITLIGRGLTTPADTVVDASGHARHARRHRRAHPPRHAVRRHDVGRRLRDRHDRRGARRHDDARRLRHPGLRRRACYPALDALDEARRGQGGHRLRAST